MKQVLITGMERLEDLVWGFLIPGLLFEMLKWVTIRVFINAGNEESDIYQKAETTVDYVMEGIYRRLPRCFVEETFLLFGVGRWNMHMTAVAFRYLEIARKDPTYVEPEPAGNWDADGVLIARSIYEQLPYLRKKLIEELKSRENFRLY